MSECEFILGSVKRDRVCETAVGLSGVWHLCPEMPSITKNAKTANLCNKLRDLC